MKNKDLAREVAQLLATQPGFTITAAGEPVPYGFTVGGLRRERGDALARFPQPTNRAQLDALTHAIEATLSNVTDLLRDGAYLGGWRENNELVLDLVTVTRGQKRAAKLAMEREQLAYGQIENYQYVREWRVNNGN